MEIFEEGMMLFKEHYFSLWDWNNKIERRIKWETESASVL
jgi:hypothetical protein